MLIYVFYRIPEQVVTFDREIYLRGEALTNITSSLILCDSMRPSHELQLRSNVEYLRSKCHKELMNLMVALMVHHQVWVTVDNHLDL